MINVRIDDYEISATKDKLNNVYIKVILDGQTIIHAKYLCNFERGDIVRNAIWEIELYNKRHNLKWGEKIARYFKF